MGDWGDEDWNMATQDANKSAGGGHNFNSDSRSSSYNSKSHSGPYSSNSYSRPSYSSRSDPVFGASGSNGSTSNSKQKVEIQSSLKIENLGSETSVTDIRGLFGRFGKITRVFCDYSILDNKTTCWLDYDQSDSISVSI